jgi:hypothetical protein
MKDLRWIVILSFFALSIVNIWFGLLGFLCMAGPFYHAVKGRGGRYHCKHHCPRGSFFSNILSRISLGNTMPRFMATKKFRHGLLAFMMVMFTLGMVHAGGDPGKIAFTMFRFMGVSFIVGILLGFFYKPKSWCAVCPMSHGATLLDNLITDRDKTGSREKKRKKKAA